MADISSTPAQSDNNSAPEQGTGQSLKRRLKQQPSAGQQQPSAKQPARKARDLGASLSGLTGLDRADNGTSRLRLLSSGLFAVGGLCAGRVCDPATAATAAGMCYAIAAIVATCGVAVPALRSHVLERLAADRDQVRAARSAERQRRVSGFKRAAAADAAATPSSRLAPTIAAEPAPQRFDPDDPALMQHLEREGFAVVKCVASAGEVAHAVDLLWGFLEDNAEMRRDDPASWADARFRLVGDPTNGIVNGQGFGQSEVCWFVRTLPRVRAAFEAIWGTQHLITSFDGGNVFRPFHRRCNADSDGTGTGASTTAPQRTSGGWWHVDQGPTKGGMQAVQGLVSLRAATEHTGGLCVIPGSHLDHDDLMRYAASNDGDYVAVPEPAINPAVRRGRLVTCMPGDLLLWDSRTIHCNTPALVDPTEQLGYPEDALLRAVTYVCMTPRSKASYGVLRARRRAFAAGVGTSHWPHEFHSGAPPWVLDAITQADVDAAFAARFGDRGDMANRVRQLVG